MAGPPGDSAAPAAGLTVSEAGESVSEGEVRLAAQAVVVDSR